MKLFLSSEALKLTGYFTELVGKDANKIKVALIENAAGSTGVAVGGTVVEVKGRLV